MRRSLSATPLALLLVAGCLSVLLGACSDDGETATTTTAPPETTTTEAPSTTEPPGEPVEILAVGDCFEERVVPGQGQTEVQQTTKIDCAEPHLNEVYLVAQMPDEIGAPFPGTEAVGDFADQACLEAFEDFVGIQYELSKWEVGYTVPTEDTWVLPDRSVVCFVFDRSGEKVKDSAAASNE